VELAGNYAFVAIGNDGFCIIDVSDPANPFEVGEYDTPLGVEELRVSGNLVYATGYKDFYIFDCSAALNLDIGITLTPLNPPIQIPATGGQFSYDVIFNNNGNLLSEFQTWIRAILPNGSITGPILGPVNLQLGGGAVLNRNRMQSVPAGAPAGIYTYTVFVGSYPNGIFDEDSFQFEKLAVGEEELVDNWNCYESDIPGNRQEFSDNVPQSALFLSAHPNPCNASSNIGFYLPEAGYINLKVYDLTGREVATLVEGEISAGEHHAIFNASNLASGIYYLRLQSEGQNSSKKIVVLK
jgi:hypothetical protein